MASRSPRLDQVNTDRLILDAAEQQIYERSFDGVGVAAIGEAAGVTPSAIYRHFSSKNEILAVLFDRAIDELVRRTSEIHDDPRVELAHLVGGHLAFALEKQKLSTIWARESRSLVDPYKRAIRRRQRTYVDRWVACLDACHPGWTRADLLAVVRAVHAVLMSDATRAPTASRSPSLQTLLTGAAMGAVSALDRSEPT